MARLHAVYVLEILSTGPTTTQIVADELRVDERTARWLLLALVGSGFAESDDGRPRTFTAGERLVRLRT